MDTGLNILFRSMGDTDARISAMDEKLLLYTNEDLAYPLPPSYREAHRALSVPYRMEQFGLLLCTAGNISFGLNTQTYELDEGKLILIPSGSVCMIKEVEDKTRVLVIIASEDMMPSRIGSADFLDLYRRMLSSVCLALPQSRVLQFRRTFSLLEESLKEPDATCRDMLSRAYMMALYGNLLSLYRETNDSVLNVRGPRSVKVFRDFISLVDKHFDTQRQLGFYADKLCLTPKYAAWLIREAGGKPALDWIRDRVILEAKLLLSDGNHSVQQVADALNFSSQSFFGKYFKTATGMSPSEYSSTVANLL